jgi:hypothetical protein
MADSTFAITRNGTALCDVELAHTDPVRLHSDLVVNEQQLYGFEITPRLPDTEFGLWIGDLEAGSSIRGDGQNATTVGFARGRFVLWDDAGYFEGSRGVVWIRICSRSVGNQSWDDLAFIAVVVTSSKLSEERYATMFNQMAGLASGLVLDLVSKMTRSLNVLPSNVRPQVHSSAVELRLLESLWPTIARCLRQIAYEPAVKLNRKPSLSRCWGSERIESRALVSMARQGVSPGNGSLQVPFKTQIARISEDTDTTEHRLIRGFIQLLHSRARDCERDLHRHIESIEADRIWRDRSQPNRPSLYIQEDVPRLEKLNNRLQRTRTLILQLRHAAEMPFLKNVRSEFSLESTPVFASIEPYRRIRHEMLKFLRSGLIVLDHGADERVKSTSRLYEQWVFLQIVSAMKHLGLECLGQQGVLHSTRRFRFTLDLDRDARVSFSAQGGRSIVVRYEPWVMPQLQAVQNRDTVYRGTKGSSAWSPDVLIEFLGCGGLPGEAAPVEYAVVVDAKYTAAIRNHHWNDTSKYLQIRATATKKQVVRQQWLAYPGGDQPDDAPVKMQDTSISWTERGPSCAIDDRFGASLQLAPPMSNPEYSPIDGWIVRPEDSAVTFVRGLLRFMEIDVPSTCLT